MEGDGEELQIRFERCETLPKATKIGLKIMGDVPEGIDLRELLEEPLSSLGVLEVGQILPTPVLEDVHLLVQELEPAGGAVFMDGAEVVLDLETDIVAPAAPEVPAPAPVAPDMFAPMVPMEPQEQESMIPPLAPPASSRRFAHPTGFVPFSGVGRRLCD
jgi:hypothetical protein